MNFEEHAAKPLLREAGIRTPKGDLASSPEEAAAIASKLGPAVIKAQVPTGKRGKSGGIALVSSAGEAQDAASRILALTIGGHRVEKVLVEEQIPIEKELYAAILNDAAMKGPLVLFSPEGGMEIEELAANHPEKLTKIGVGIQTGLERVTLLKQMPEFGVVSRDAIADLFQRLYAAYTNYDAELIEINPLVVTKDGELIALDCKFTLDDSAIKRQDELAKNGTPDPLTPAEEQAQKIGFKYIELDGNVGILANGAGLTMTSMDAVRHYGGKPANFLEIGGEAYRLGKEALETVLSNKGVKSLLINFCGAFARTDVMVEGIIAAWQDLKPDIPIFFTIHGTGEDEAIQMVRERLGQEPFDVMDDAVKASVEAAK